MKILYHHRIVSKDGQYVHLEEMVKALTRQGHEILLVGPKIVETTEFGSEGGMISWLKKYVPKVIYEILEFSYSFYDFFKVLFYIAKFKPDGIYERYNLLFVSGIWVKKLTNLPLLLEINSPLYEERSKFGGIGFQSLARWSENYCWKNADYRLPVTQVLAQRVIESTAMTNKLEVIHNGINYERFSETKETEYYKQKSGLQGKLVLGFTGFVREWHGIEQVIDILKEYQAKNLHLLLVGDGPARESLEKYALSLDVASSVSITGIVQRDDVNQYVSAFDIALQPAVVPYASPLKMFEYLALGRLIVAPDDDNIKEILQDGVNAILFESGNDSAFKQAIIQAIEIDDAEKAALSLRAKETIKEKGFTWENNASRVVDLFNKLKINRNS